MIHVTHLEQIEPLPAEANPAPQGPEALPIGAIALQPEANSSGRRAL